MSNEKLKPLLAVVTGEDGKPIYCCVKAWLHAHRGIRTSLVADAWEVSVRTVRIWRRKDKLGECKCEHNENCRIAKNAKAQDK